MDLYGSCPHCAHRAVFVELAPRGRCKSCGGEFLLVAPEETTGETTGDLGGELGVVRLLPVTEQDEPELEGFDVLAPHPWARFGARYLDLNLWSFLVYASLSWTGLIDLPEAWQLGWSRTLVVTSWIALFLVTWIPVEALLLSRTTTTPGKALLGMRVRTREGEALSYREALRRGLDVTLVGMGLGVPLLCQYLMLRAYLELRQSNRTHWDQAAASVVVHRAPDPLRVGIAIVLFVVLSSSGEVYEALR